MSRNVNRLKTPHPASAESSAPAMTSSSSTAVGAGQPAPQTTAPVPPRAVNRRCAPRAQRAMLSALVRAVVLFGSVYVVVGRGVVLNLLILYTFALLGGKLSLRAKLPGLVGMLLAGFVVRNLELVETTSDDWKRVAGVAKGLALAVILLRAGFGIDFDMLRRKAVLMGVVASVPCLVEAGTVAGASMWLFSWAGFDAKWGLLLGFVLADVSPAVTVPLLLDFQLLGYGRNKGIPTILLAGSGLNSVFAIVGYGIVFGLLFASSGRPIWLVAVLGLVEVLVLGVLGGWLAARLLMLLWGVIGDEQPAAAKGGGTKQGDVQHNKSVSPYAHFAAVLAVAAMLVFGSKRVAMSGGGALAVLCMGVVLKQGVPRASPSGFMELEAVLHMLNILWSSVGQVMLFALLGCAMTLDSLDPGIVGAGVAVITIGLLARTFAMLLCVQWTGWNFRERLFAALTWCPKATVQAALSTVALDYVVDNFTSSDPSYAVLHERASVLLTVAVLSIIMTAPLFAVVIAVTGRSWLERGGSSTETSDRSSLDDERTSSSMTSVDAFVSGANSPNKQSAGFPPRESDQIHPAVPRQLNLSLTYMPSHEWLGSKELELIARDKVEASRLSRVDGIHTNVGALTGSTQLRIHSVI